MARSASTPRSSRCGSTRPNILAVLANIHQTGWSGDGATPGRHAGAVLIAGHVDRRPASPGRSSVQGREGGGDRSRSDLERPHVHVPGRLGEDYLKRTCPRASTRRQGGRASSW